MNGWSIGTLVRIFYVSDVFFDDLILKFIRIANIANMMGYLNYVFSMEVIVFIISSF